MIVFSSAHARLRAAPHAHVTAPRPRWAVRPLAACEPSPLLVTGARRRRAGLSVRWRPANRLACSATLRRGRSQALPSRMHGKEQQHRARITFDNAEVSNGNALVRPPNQPRRSHVHEAAAQGAGSVGTVPQNTKARHSSVSAPRILGCFGTKALRRSGVACRSERSFIAPGPNPSIERTVSSGLRPLVTAAHVKR